MVSESREMVGRIETMIRLNKEKAYEDELVSILSSFFIDSLPGVSGLDDAERVRVKRDLETIKRDSVEHSRLFGEMLQLVFESDEDDRF